MADYKMNAVLRLRIDTLGAYTSVGDTLIPKNGEVCLVNTGSGNRAKIGDGIHTFNQLEFSTLGVIGSGYYFNGEFYKEPEHITKMDTFSLIYIDWHTIKLYYYTGAGYALIYDIKQATATEAGILKLYDKWNGTNTDGSVTQEAISSKFNDIQRQLDAMKIKISSVATGEYMAQFAGFNVEAL